MSDTEQSRNPRKALAEAFNVDTDPLHRYEETFQQTDTDPFEPFLTDVLNSRDIATGTVKLYQSLWQQWSEHMNRVGRYPACPNVTHVKEFARCELDEKGNSARTVAEKLRKLDDLYEYWQTDPVFPHGDDFNPFALARSTIELAYEEPKEPPRLMVGELQSVLDFVPHWRDYAIIFFQLKLGLRATELCNMELSEVNLVDAELRSQLPSVGNDDRVVAYENALLVPDDRAGNKSRRPRILPLDEETQYVFREYLRRRPIVDEPYVFLSKQRRKQLRKQDINRVWKDAFHPEYAETDDHRAITSHYGRHYFTTYWRVQQDLSQELVKYMRGDTPGPANMDEMGAINEYIHSYYEDIESVYREEMFELMS